MPSMLRHCLAKLSALQLDDKHDPASREVRLTRDKLGDLLKAGMDGITREQIHELVNLLSLLETRCHCGDHEAIREAARDANALVRLSASPGLRLALGMARMLTLNRFKYFYGCR